MRLKIVPIEDTREKKVPKFNDNDVFAFDIEIPLTNGKIGKVEDKEIEYYGVHRAENNIWDEGDSHTGDKYNKNVEVYLVYKGYEAELIGYYKLDEPWTLTRITSNGKTVRMNGVQLI